ncbi:MAG TPA: HPF/RaiA family ribosome-associated protein [Flavobacteriales bacterium]|jgi:ribosomal subunit interface protein
MKLRIESPGHRLSPSLKAYATEKLSKLERFYKDIQEVEATLLHEEKANKEKIVCTLNIRVPGKDEYIKTNSVIFEDAVLKAVDAAKRRLSVRKTQLEKAAKLKTTNRTVIAKKVAKKAAKKAAKQK